MTRGYLKSKTILLLAIGSWKFELVLSSREKNEFVKVSFDKLPKGASIEKIGVDE